MGIFYAIRNFVMGFVGAISAPFVWLAAQVSGPSRSRALVFGMPALVAFLICLIMLAAVVLGQEERIKQRYLRLAETAKSKAEATLRTYFQERQLASQTQAANPGQEVAEGLEEQLSPLVKQLKEERAIQQLYLEKLITLDNDSKYRYEYARSFNEVSPGMQLKLLQQLAPLERIGYGDAHLFLAQVYFNSVVTDPARERQLRNAALIHADFALQRTPESIQAKTIKLASLMSLNRYSEGLALAEELFKADPLNYRDLVIINRELNRRQEMNNALSDATRRLEERVRELRQSDVEAWAKHVNAYVQAMAVSGRYEEARRRLEQEMDLVATGESAGKVLFLRRLKAELAIAWVRSMTPGIDAPSEVIQKCLPLLEEALQELPRQPDALWLLTLISFRTDEWQARAKAIYDPESDPDAPPTVLNQLGKQALLEKNFASAIDQFEKARQIDTQNPELLNNLAFAYLTAGVGDPEYALGLVNEAISILPPIPQFEALRSSFFHTKGTALLMLMRFEEAANAFGIALEARPENEGILEGIVKAYEAQGSKQADIYREKLKQVRERTGNQ
ncbi:MAG TPA: hypothetical protein PKD54_11295 [Pirellulaceae bacterium]|nr:hypothetical protein [Pirellulaceae bacterium]